MCVTSAAEDLIYLLYVDDWGLTSLFPFLSEGQSPEKGSFFLLSAGNSWNWGKQNTASAGVHSLKMSRLLKSLLSLAISGPACQTKNQPLNLLPFFTLCSVFEGLGNKTPITKTWPKTCSSEASHKIQGLSKAKQMFCGSIRMWTQVFPFSGYCFYFCFPPACILQGSIKQTGSNPLQTTVITNSQSAPLTFGLYSFIPHR